MLSGYREGIMQCSAHYTDRGGAQLIVEDVTMLRTERAEILFVCTPLVTDILAGVH